MPEYGFSLTRIFRYKDRIVDFVLIPESAGQRKPVFWHILRNVYVRIRKSRLLKLPLNYFQVDVKTTKTQIDEETNIV